MFCVLYLWKCTWQLTSQDKWYTIVRAMKCSPATSTKAIPWDEKMGNDPFKSKELEQYLLLFLWCQQLLSLNLPWIDHPWTEKLKNISWWIMCTFVFVQSLLPSSGRQTTAMPVKDFQMVTWKFIIFILGKGDFSFHSCMCLWFLCVCGKCTLRIFLLFPAHTCHQDSVELIKKLFLYLILCM